MPDLPHSLTQEQISKALDDISKLLTLENGPNTFITIALNFVQGQSATSLKDKAFSYGKLVAKALWNIGTAHQGLWAKGSVGTFVQALVAYTGLVLQDPTFQEIATMPKVLKEMHDQAKNISGTVAARVPKLAKLKPLIESLVFTGTELMSGLQPANLRTMIRLTGMIIDPDMTEDAKGPATKTLTALGSDLLKLKTVQETIINPDLWSKIATSGQELAVVAGLPYTLFPLAAELIKEISTVVQTRADEVKAIIEHAAILIDPTIKDQDKMQNLFALCDKAIALAKSSPETLKILQKYKGTIASGLSAYMPAGIDALKVVETMIKPEVLAKLEKAYTQYKDGSILKAVATAATSLDLLKLAAPAALVFIKASLLNWIPNFMRRYHVKETVNEKLASKADEKDLKTLCQPSILELDPIRRHAFNGCFKGLKIKHDLDDFVIDGFDFRGASLGIQAAGPGKFAARELERQGRAVVSPEVKEGFSLAKSKISNSNFKGVEFKGSTIDLSGMEIDAASFETLAPSILQAQKKGKAIKVEKIKITGKETDKAKRQLDQIIKLSAEQKARSEQKGRQF
jgi:hypothetical protein